MPGTPQWRSDDLGSGSSGSIERELHDVVVPQLFVLTTGLELLRKQSDTRSAGKLVVDLALTAERVLADLRAISRGERLDWAITQTESLIVAAVGLFCCPCLLNLHTHDRPHSFRCLTFFFEGRMIPLETFLFGRRGGVMARARSGVKRRAGRTARGLASRAVLWSARVCVLR